MSATWLALPPHAWAQALAHRGEDADLRPGTHLRLLPGPALGWPVAPLGVWRVPATRRDQPRLVWHNRINQAVAQPHLDANGGELFARVLNDPPVTGPRIGVEVLLPPGERGSLELLEGPFRRLMARRSEERLLIGAPTPRFIRITGSGVPSVRTWWLDENRCAMHLLETRPLHQWGLPLDEDLPWYSGALGDDAARRRVAEAAPMRQTAADQPDGPALPLTPDDELARLDDFAHRLRELAFTAARDVGLPPGAQRQTRSEAAVVLADGQIQPWTEVDSDLLGELRLAMLDPGAARYLGFMGWLDEVPDEPDPRGHPSADVLMIGGVFVCEPGSALATQAPDAAEQRLLATWMHRHPSLERVQRLALQHGAVLRVQMAPALVAPPPDRPDAPRLQPGHARWLRPPQGGRCTEYQHAIWLNQAPFGPSLAGPVAVAWRIGTGALAHWHSRHAPSGPSGRAALRVAGVRDPQAALAQGGLVQGLLEETPLPESGDGGAPWLCRVAMGDLFGRYGAAAEIALPLPDRPPVPLPTLQTDIVQVALPAGVGEDAASPGQLRLRVPVPATEELAAGALPLANLLVTLDGLAQPPLPVQPRVASSSVWPLPNLLPGTQGQLTLAAEFEDSAGRRSPAATSVLRFADARAPRVPPSGVGLLWTAQPGPAADVNVRLALPGRPGERWRVFMAGDHALSETVPEGQAEAPLPSTRAHIAVQRSAETWAPSRDRNRYRLLTEDPLEVAGDGWAWLEFSLPRSLSAVQFLRAVPVSAQGMEAPFESGLRLALAVPDDRTPPAPHLQAEVDAATAGVTLHAQADGLDLVALQAAEPGLFTQPPAADARAPVLRLRRAAGFPADPAFARVVAEVPMRWNGSAFVVELQDVDEAGLPLPLPGYLPLNYWAEVRLPPERRLPADHALLTWPEEGLQPAHASQLQDKPGPWSRASAPAPAMFVPPQIPELDPVACQAHAQAVAVGWRVNISIQGPTRAQRALRSFSLQVYTETADGQRRAWPLDPPPPLDPQGRALLPLDGADMATLPVAVWLVLTDPAGRSAAPLRVDVTPP